MDWAPTWPSWRRSSEVWNRPPNCDVLVCPPATLIARAVVVVKGAFALGGQDCHDKASGAFTGDISAEMLKDAGASAVIVGHSERRQYHGESDSQVAAKARAAWRGGSLSHHLHRRDRKPARRGRSASRMPQPDHRQRSRERHAGKHRRLPMSRSGRSAPAGRPAMTRSPPCMPISANAWWAIWARRGRGCGFSMAARSSPPMPKPILALENVNGALVGGASLKAHEFLGIISAAKGLK